MATESETKFIGLKMQFEFGDSKRDAVMLVLHTSARSVKSSDAIPQLVQCAAPQSRRQSIKMESKLPGKNRGRAREGSGLELWAVISVKTGLGSFMDTFPVMW